MNKLSIAAAALITSFAANAADLYQSTDFPMSHPADISIPGLDVHGINSIKVWVGEHPVMPEPMLEKVVIDMMMADDIVITGFEPSAPDQYSAKVPGAWMFRNLTANVLLTQDLSSVSVDLGFESSFDPTYPQFHTVFQADSAITFAGPNPIADATTVKMAGKNLQLKLLQRAITPASDGNMYGPMSPAFVIDANWFGNGHRTLTTMAPVDPMLVGQQKAIRLSLQPMPSMNPEFEMDYEVMLVVEDKDQMRTSLPAGLLSDLLYQAYPPVDMPY